MSIPRELSVFEYEGGKIQSSFNLRGSTNKIDQTISCKVDDIEYKSFSLEVGRKFECANVVLRASFQNNLVNKTHLYSTKIPKMKRY